MADVQTRHDRGLLVVLALAAMFFALLGLIILERGDAAKSDQSPPSESLIVLPSRLRIRTDPQARAPVVATATSGEQVKLLEDRGAWVRVETGDGLSGWAERANLERIAEQARRAKRFAAIRKLPPLEGEVTEHAQLYAGPGIYFPLLGDLSRGTSVKVFTRDHDFYAVAQGDGIAYAPIDAIDISAPSSRQVDVGTNEETASATETAVPPLPPVADTATTEPPLVGSEPLIPEPELAEPASGVYSAVPPGGTQPEEIERIIPRYPNSARRAGIEGAVVVRGIVRKDGRIDNVEVIKDLPQGLGEEARRAVSQWRFRPATYRGEPIDVYYTVTVNFRLR